MDIKEYISSGIIESYVLGLATEEEVSILECVRKNNPQVEQAIVDAQLSLEKLASVQAVLPDESLKDDIWERISAGADQEPVSGNLDSQVSSAQTSPEKVRPIVEQPKKFQPLWVAASVLLVGSIALNLIFFKGRQENLEEIKLAKIENQQNAQELAEYNNRWRMLQRPSVKMVTLAGVEKFPDLKALVFWDVETSQVLLAAENLPAAPADKQYQLWAIVDGAPVDAGVLPLASPADSLVEMQRISGAQAFAITLEKAGGSATPTLTDMYVIGNI